MRIPDLPGCETFGDTLEEAWEMMEDAKRTWIEAQLDDGHPVPAPRDEDDYSGKFVVRVGRSLHRDLVRLAGLEGMSLNAFVTSVLARETGRHSGGHDLREVVSRIPEDHEPTELDWGRAAGKEAR